MNARRYFKNTEIRGGWRTLISILVVLAAIEIPFHIIFLYKTEGILYWLDLFTSIVFGIDIWVNYSFNFSYKKKLKLADKGKDESQRRKTLIIDVLTALPLELLVTLVFADNISQFLMAIRLIRLLKLGHLMQYLKDWQIAHSLDSVVSRLVVFAFWFMLLAHWIACGFIFLGGVSKFDSNIERYVRAFYWCVTTLATVGYGDIIPVTIPQTIYNTFVMIFGVCVYGYLIGNITGIFVNAEVAEKQFIDSVDRLNSYMKHHEVPDELQERIHNYQKYMWNNHVGNNEELIMTLLSPALRFEIALHIHKEQLQKVPLFKEASDDLLREIVLKIKPVVFSPGDYIFRSGDLGSEMYFISKGTVEIISKENDVLATLVSGQFFGEMALVMNQVRNASVQAKSYCDLYLLDKHSFDFVVGRHPDFAEKIQEKVKILLDKKR